MTAQQMALRARGMIPDAGYTDSYWRSLFYFNIYRLIVATLLLVTAAVFEDAAFGTRSLTGCSCTRPSSTSCSRFFSVATSPRTARTSTSSSGFRSSPTWCS